MGFTNWRFMYSTFKARSGLHHALPAACSAACPACGLRPWWCFQGKTVYMIDLFVRPGFRGTGAGRALMSFCAGCEHAASR